MSTNNKHNDLTSFRKYYTGAMNPDEKIVFEKNIESDPFAKEAFEGFLLLESDFKRISAIENTNMALKKKFNIEEKGLSFSLKPFFVIAASLVLFIGSYFAIQNNIFNNKNEFADNHEVKTIKEASDNKITEVNTIMPDSSFNHFDTTTTTTTLLEEEIEDKELVEQEIIQKDKETTVSKEIITVKKQETVQEAIISEPKKQLGAKEYEFYRNQKTNNNSNIIETTTQVNKMTTSSDLATNTMFYNDDNFSESSRTESVSDFKQGIEAYNNSEYVKAIRLFNLSINKKTKINSSNFYIGMSFFNQNKSTKAVKYFDKTINSTSGLKDQAMWYKSLSLIKKGQKNEALILLNTIANSNSRFKDSAARKLREL